MTLTIHFCTTCGTKIYKEGNAGAFIGMAIVQAGTLDAGKGMGIEDVNVQVELYVKDRVKWMSAREGAGQCVEFS